MEHKIDHKTEVGCQRKEVSNPSLKKCDQRHGKKKFTFVDTNC